MAKITICGSIAFYEHMTQMREKLEQHGHQVKLPPAEIEDENGSKIPVTDYYALRKAEKPADWLWERKQEAMHAHFQKVAWSDAILVLNHDKNNIPGYIGANTLLEMGIAMHLRKKIYLLNPIPDISYKEEILGMHPQVIDGDLRKI